MVPFFLLWTLVSTAQATEIKILVSGDLRGEIKPCGCSPEGDLGGLSRRASFLKQTLSNHSIYLDLGNNFPEPSDQGLLKIQLIQAALKLLKPSVILVGPNELDYGISVLDPQLPYLLSNASEKSPWKRQSLITKGKTSIGIWGFLSPQQLYQNPNEPALILPLTPQLLAQWKTEIQHVKALHSILLFRGTVEELQLIEKAKIFDEVLLGSNNADELNQVLALKTKTRSYSMIPTKGQGVLVGTFHKKRLSLKPVWLTKNYEDAPQLTPLFETYEEQVKVLFLAHLEGESKDLKESHYVGNETCQGCHSKASQIWNKSRHGHAWQTLKTVKKQFDPECVQCHVVGFKEKGFLSEEWTPHLANVQCENCHGPAKQHVENPTNHPPLDPKKACQSCHHGSHSPVFDYSNYWKKIKH